MPLTIRPVRAEDYPALAACFGAALPGTSDDGDSLQEEDQHTVAFERWVAEVDGRVAGTVSWFQTTARLHPRKFWMDGAVFPEYQGRGIGTALFAQVLEAVRPRDPILLRTFTREDLTSARHFLEQRGFVEAKRTWESWLDLVAFDFGRYAGQPEQVEARGIRLVTLPALQSETGWEQRLLDLYNAIQADVPDIDPAAVTPMETFKRTYLGSSTFMADGQFVALDGDLWVGMSTLWKWPESGTVNTGLTGVLPDYRRCGIALALKLRGLVWARGQGITRVRTTNASTNRGMLAINERLGFKRRPAWLHLVREF